MAIKYETTCYECDITIHASTEAELQKHFKTAGHKKKAASNELAQHYASYPIYRMGGEPKFCPTCSMEQWEKADNSIRWSSTAHLVLFPCAYYLENSKVSA